MTEGTQVDNRYSVGEVAGMFGVTVRTLHHYDDVGLLVPSERSSAGYRRYTEADITRLSQVVVYRRLEISLEQIARLLDDEADVAEHLRRQRATVMTRLDELHELVAAIDTALEKTMSNEDLTTSERRALFGENFEDWQAEARERWGDTDAWRQSAKSTGAFTSEDWQAVRDTGEAIDAAFAAAADAGLPATSVEAMDAAEAHRLGIERYYDCSYRMQRDLADMYLSDPRFTQYYENVRVGMAQYVHDAIHANADRHGG